MKRPKYIKHCRELVTDEEMKEKRCFWNDHPKHKMGPHDGWSDKKRPKSRL